MTNTEWIKELCGSYVEPWVAEQLGETLDEKDTRIAQLTMVVRAYQAQRAQWAQAVRAIVDLDKRDEEESGAYTDETHAARFEFDFPGLLKWLEE